MNFNNAIDTRTSIGAQQALKEMSDHYSANNAQGRLAFSRDQTGQLTGVDRSRGVMANLKSIVINDYTTSAKTEFEALIRTAYPDHADDILNHIAARQRETGVTDMVTPGMVKEAYAKAQELAAWPPDASAADLVAHPNGEDPRRKELAAAIGLIKDGAKPTIDGSDSGEIAQVKYFAQKQLQNPNQFTACHDTAVQLQDVMGRPETEIRAGGKGSAKRQEAIDAAIDALNHGPCIIQVKGTATADGHSFSLIRKPDGSVDVLEAWATGHGDADLGRLLGQCKKNLPLAEVVDALQKIASHDPQERTEGYTALSTAYNDAVLFELHHDPRGEETHEDCRDQDHNIKLEVNIRTLRPFQEINDRMQARLQLVDEFIDDVALTRSEERLLRQNRVDLQGISVKDD